MKRAPRHRRALPAQPPDRAPWVQVRVYRPDRDGSSPLWVPDDTPLDRPDVADFADLLGLWWEPEPEPDEGVGGGA